MLIAGQTLLRIKKHANESREGVDSELHSALTVNQYSNLVSRAGIETPDPTVPSSYHKVKTATVYWMFYKVFL